MPLPAVAESEQSPPPTERPTSPTTIVPPPLASIPYEKPPSFDDYLCSLISSQTSPSTNGLGTHYPLSNSLSYHRFWPSHCSFLSSLAVDTEPKSYSEAKNFPEWRNAIQSEIDALHTS